MQSGKGKTVLVIDDNEAVLEVITFQLEEVGFSVVSTDDPTKVDSLLDEYTIDAVICDYRMPQMGGVETIKKIREQKGKAIPIVMLTGMLGLDRNSILKVGANELMEKPLDVNRFKKILDTEIEEFKILDPKASRSIELRSTATPISSSEELVEINMEEFGEEGFIFSAPKLAGKIGVEYLFHVICQNEDKELDFSFNGQIKQIDRKEKTELWEVENQKLDLGIFNDFQDVYVKRQNAIMDFLRQVKGRG